MRFGVGWASFLRKAFEDGLGIAVAKLRSGVAARRALGEDFERGVQPDGDRALVEQLARARIDIGAAPGSNDSDVTFDEPGDQPAFAVAEVLLAATLQHFGRGSTGRAPRHG